MKKNVLLLASLLLLSGCQGTTKEKPSQDTSVKTLDEMSYGRTKKNVSLVHLEFSQLKESQIKK